MTSPESPKFVDPVLKDAVVRAWGAESAPAGLADRCRAAMAEADDAAEPLRIDRGDVRLNYRTWGGWALAATLLLVVGITWVYFTADPTSPASPTGNAVLAGGIPVSLVKNVISTHDHCSSRYINDHHNVACSKTDYSKIKQTLESRLGHPVWVTPVAGWEFRGAADCRMGGDHVQCSHLLFARPQRNQTLSIFSVPFEGSCTLRPTETFADQIEQHPVAGFVEGEQMHCLVGYAPDGSLTVDELRTTTETYRGNLHAIRIVYPDLPPIPTHLARTTYNANN